MKLNQLALYFSKLKKNQSNINIHKIKLTQSNEKTEKTEEGNSFTMSLLSSILSSPQQPTSTPTSTPTTTTTSNNNSNNNNHNNNNNNNSSNLNPTTPTTPNNTTPIPNTTAPVTTPTPVPTTPTPTTPTNTTTTTTTPSVASPTPIPIPTTNSTTNFTAPSPETTQVRTITTGTGNDASVVVITQTAYAPTSTSDANPSSSNDNRGSASTSKIIAIAIPSAIGGLAALIILFMGIRALLRRSAAKRAADDIRWPETVTSEGDRAALYPEPTRPSPGHGLGLVEDEEEHTSPEMNMAGAGAGRLRPGASVGPTRSHSVTTTGLSSTSHYQPFEYGNNPDYMLHGISPPPPSHLPGALMPAYGMNPSQQQKGMVTYPPDWNRNGFGTGHSPEMMARSNGPTRTSLVYPNETYANWDQPREMDESDPHNHRRYSSNQPLPYLLPPLNTNHSGSPSSHRQTSSNGGSEELNLGSSNVEASNHLDGPREIQYAPYSHGGYGGETNEESDQILDHAHQDHHDDSISIKSDLKGSPEWKLGVNNPDAD